MNDPIISDAVVEGGKNVGNAGGLLALGYMVVNIFKKKVEVDDAKELKVLETINTKMDIIVSSLSEVKAKVDVLSERMSGVLVRVDKNETRLEEAIERIAKLEGAFEHLSEQLAK